MNDYGIEYNDVATRRAQFAARYPMGSLQPADLSTPYRIEHMPDGSTFIAYVAAAYRYPGDPTPGIGTAWEPFPGKSEITQDSELQNAETSAWGRAIAAAFAADTHRIATIEDVQRRQSDRDAVRREPTPAAAVKPPAVPAKPSSADKRKFDAAVKRLGIERTRLPDLFAAKFGTDALFSNASALELAEFREHLVLAFPACLSASEPTVDAPEPDAAEAS